MLVPGQCLAVSSAPDFPTPAYWLKGEGVERRVGFGQSTQHSLKIALINASSVRDNVSTVGLNVKGRSKLSVL